MPLRAFRLTAKLAASLMAGALATVVVAWACALSRPSLNFNLIAASEWPARVPHDWPAPYSLALEYRGAGTRRVELGAPLSRVAAPRLGSERSISVTHNVAEGVNLEVSQAGWPWLSLQSTRKSVTTLQAGQQRIGADDWLSLPIPQRFMTGPGDATLPLHPLLPGFLLNTAFYATLLFTLFTTPRLIRRHLRRRKHHCPTCNYNLRGLAPTSPCPECGP
jgi:hypothetical protein